MDITMVYMHMYEPVNKLFDIVPESICDRKEPLPCHTLWGGYKHSLLTGIKWK